MQKGFTVIELIIVIVVIGLLVTIGVVSYGSFQRRAHDTAVQSDLEAIAGELESYRARMNGTGTTPRFAINATELGTLEIQAAKSSYNTSVSYNMIYCVGNSNQSFKLIAQSKSQNIYVMTEEGFVSNTLTTSNLTATLCTSQGMSLGANGMTSGPTWASWVRSN
jgi:prepilin-type N-terminal cleavage/methylation domain-containing protein